jgi:hypothetical protein
MVSDDTGQPSVTLGSTAAPATVRAVTALSTHRRLTCAATIAVLALAGCGGGHPQHAPTHSTAPTLGSIPASEGAIAIFRADVTPILCRYAQDVAKSAQLIAQASSDAGGPIDASAPESAQAQYASALALYASLLATDYAAFTTVHAPTALDDSYKQFLESLGTLSHQADRVAQYAHARNFTAIANEQYLQIPTAGQGVFREAGITSCAVPGA